MLTAVSPVRKDSGSRAEGSKEDVLCSGKGVSLPDLHLLQKSPRSMAAPRDAALVPLDPPPHPSGRAQLLRASPGSKGLDVRLYER